MRWISLQKTPVCLVACALTSACLAPEFRIKEDGSGSGGQNGSGGSSDGGSSGGNSGTGGASSGGSSSGSGATSGVGGSSGGVPGSGGSSSSGGSGSGGNGTGGASGPAVLSGVETVGAFCPLPALKTYAELTEFPKFPSPFTMANGDGVATKKDWECRHREIVAMLEGYELGDKPSKPDSVVGSFSESELTVTLYEGGGTGSFRATIQYPTGGATGPFPAMIVLGQSSLSDHLLSIGVATVTLDVENEIRPLDDRTVGLFSSLTGGSSAGALLAWSWGVSRIIDALEVTPAANIDETHVGVTGCPFGMAALVAGALDARIALTIAQDTAAGGVAPWRAAAYEDANSLDDVVFEHHWFAEAIEMFSGAVDRMPYDRHALVGLVAPRGLLTLASDNVSFLPYATAQGMYFGRDAFAALGAFSNIGFVMSTHTECQEPAASSDEEEAVNAFVQTFLQEGGASTNFWIEEGDLPPDDDRWRTWYSPTTLPD